MSARASATRCRWPPESWWGLRFASGAELHHVERLLDALRPHALLELHAPQAVADVLRHGHVRKQRIGLKHHVDRPLVRRHAVMSASSITMRPALGSANPASMRSSVVLPHPEPPTSANISPL
jgi:hypothetical protein